MTNTAGCLTPLWLLFGLIGGFIFFGQVAPATDVTPMANSEPIPMTTLEVVLAPAESMTIEEFQQAYAIINRRVFTLTTEQQIGMAYTFDINENDRTLTLRFPETATLDGAVLDALLAPGYLEFVDFSAVDSAMVESYIGQVIATSASVARNNDNRGQIVFPTVLTNEDIAFVNAESGEAINIPSTYFISVEMTPEGAERLGVFTANNIGNAMAIVLDGVVLSAPVIQNRVAESVIITGNFTQAEALALAAQIRSDPLPSAMVVESITMVAP
jgi:hypothetical protein